MWDVVWTVLHFVLSLLGAVAIAIPLFALVTSYMCYRIDCKYADLEDDRLRRLKDFMLRQQASGATPAEAYELAGAVFGYKRSGMGQ